MQTTALKGNSKSRQISEASNIAADRIERIMSLPYDSHSNNIDDDGDGYTDDWNEQFSDGAGANAGTAGLDDINNPDGFNDLDHNGLADDRDGDGIPDVCWNIAEDYPLPNTKTIKVIVDSPGSARSVEMIYIKMDKI